MYRNKLHNFFPPIIVFSFFIISSCNSIDKKELKVIDNVPLGISVTQFDSLLPILNIESKSFLTTIFFMNYEFSSHSMTFPYTKNFDFSNYRSDRNQHLGLLYPITIAGTNNITSLAVILVHTEHPFFVLPKNVEPQNIGNDYTSISQNISTKVIDAIEAMYNSKYGKAKDTVTESTFINFYKLEGTEIKSYRPPEIKGIYQELIWETKYLKIRFFTGIPSTEEKFDTKSNHYEYTIGINSQGNAEVRNIVIDYNNGETMCESYPYIQYELKQDVIDKLKLGNMKI